ncbi:MAG: hypothetical protein CSA24_02375 [Deltaproteobacteria bacterium]|nr:MAG: hypothetical protein CSA24_02375 [Deltaproteobacteria bacterium]
MASALGDRKVGARTVAMMIDQAIGSARTSEGRGRMGKSTVFLRSMVNQAVTTSTRRFKVISIVLFALLLGSVGGFLALRYYERKQAKESDAQLRKQMASLMTTLNQQGGLSPDKRKALADQLKDVRKRLAGSATVAAGKSIVLANRDAIFLMAFSGGGQSKGFCTAFAVRKRVLATNAHCVVALARFQQMGYRTFLVMNRQPKRIYRLKRAVRHPRYHKPMTSISEDVGLVFVSEDLPKQVTFASDAVLKQLESGDRMYTYGFPGRLARVHSPNATLAQGIVGRLTKLNGDHGSFRQNRLLQHSAFTSGGTSGSPIFDERGEVIAVNAGGYVESGTMKVVDPATGTSRKVRVAKQLSGYNFGIRVDVLRELLAKY